MIDKFKKAYNEKLLKYFDGQQDLVDQWWDSPLEVFNGESPNERWDSSREDVARYIIYNMIV